MTGSHETLAPTTMPLPAGAKARDFVRAVDPWIAIASMVLVGLGTVLVYSASAIRSSTHGASEDFLLRHLFAIGLGLSAMTVALRVKIELWSRIAYPLLGVSLLLLLGTLIPGLGRQVHGAHRWLQLGPISGQPSEIAKLAVVVYLAHSLAKKRERASTFSVGFLPHVVMTSLAVSLLLSQPDIGTAAVIYTTLGLMLFAAGTRVSYLVLAVVFALPAVFHYVMTHAHARARLAVFLKPEAYRHNIGYQVWESLVSFGSGGSVGLGIGAGRQKLYFLPEAHTDFVFSVLGQELGFVGVVVTIGAFAFIVGRGLWWASKLPCRFVAFLTFGISVWIGVQALVNMAVATALLPTKGLTLPFLSYGRTSMVVTLLAVGIVLRASAEAKLSSGPPARAGARKRKGGLR